MSRKTDKSIVLVHIQSGDADQCLSVRSGNAIIAAVAAGRFQFLHFRSGLSGKSLEQLLQYFVHHDCLRVNYIANLALFLHKLHIFVFQHIWIARAGVRNKN